MPANGVAYAVVRIVRDDARSHLCERSPVARSPHMASTHTCGARMTSSAAEPCMSGPAAGQPGGFQCKSHTAPWCCLATLRLARKRVASAGFIPHNLVPFRDVLQKTEASIKHLTHRFLHVWHRASGSYITRPSQEIWNLGLRSCSSAHAQKLIGFW